MPNARISVARLTAKTRCWLFGMLSLLVSLIVLAGWGFSHGFGLPSGRPLLLTEAVIPPTSQLSAPAPTVVPVASPPTTPSPPPSEPAAPAGSGWRIPILMYHYVRTVDPAQDQLGYNLSVTPEQLTAQLDYLVAHGYHTIDLALLSKDDPLPEKPIILTFDDGYADFATAAWPIIKAHQMTAVQYVVSGFIGRAGYLSADQVKQLATEGVVIGAHTVHHLNLTTLDAGRLTAELTESKTMLEALIGQPVPWFAYPAGRYDATVLAAIQQAGYAQAVTTNAGFATNQDDRFQLPRVRISGGDSLAAFAQKIEQ